MVRICILISVILLNLVYSETFAAEKDPTPIPNWTVGAQGQGRWAYGQYSQTGPNGFFGPYNVDMSVDPGNLILGDFAPLNGWMGVQNYEDPNNLNILTSGTNSAATTVVFELNPTATFGWASVNGRYKINPYNTASKIGSEVSISPGQWTHWYIGVTPPVGGSIFMGKSYFQRGCGLQFGQNRTKEYILFESDYITVPDPLARLFPNLVRYPRAYPISPPSVMKVCRKPKPCPQRELHCPPKEAPYFLMTSEQILNCLDGKECQKIDICDDCPEGMYPVRVLDPGTRQEILYTEIIGKEVYTEDFYDTAFLKFGLGVMPWQQYSLQITPLNIYEPWNIYDVNIAPRVNMLAYLMWNNEVIEFELGTLYSSAHAGPELASTTLTRKSFPTVDQYTSEGWIYLQYWNGRFKFRTELDWFTRETRFQRSYTEPPPPPPASEGSGSPFAPQFVDSLRFMADASVYFGPAMLTLFYSHMPGPDRRHGILIKKQPYVNAVPQVALDPFYPVSALLAYRFGGGVNSPGDLSDASVIAGKIDYALAANLTVSASLLHATRVSHGYGIGWIRPSTKAFGQVSYDPELKSYLIQPPFPPPPAPPPQRPAFDERIPAIPSRDLGWEVNVGLFWQLLEQLNINLTVSYWKPGDWFKYACVDKSVRGWNFPNRDNNWGVNPNRSIDPVIGIELAVLSSY